MCGCSFEHVHLPLPRLSVHRSGAVHEWRSGVGENLALSLFFLILHIRVFALGDIVLLLLDEVDIFFFDEIEVRLGHGVRLIGELGSLGLRSLGLGGGTLGLLWGALGPGRLPGGSALALSRSSVCGFVRGSERRHIGQICLLLETGQAVLDCADGQTWIGCAKWLE